MTCSQPRVLVRQECKFCFVLVWFFVSSGFDAKRAPSTARPIPLSAETKLLPLPANYELTHCDDETTGAATVVIPLDGASLVSRRADKTSLATYQSFLVCRESAPGSKRVAVFLDTEESKIHLCTLGGIFRISPAGCDVL